MADVKVIVSLTADAADHYGDVVLACERAGLRVDQQLPGLGVVTGQIEASTIDELRRVAGVDAVELDQRIVLPPPDSPVQ